MNDFLSKNRLKELAQINQYPCVSIYMPTHRLGAETQQDPIRLRNLLDQAQEQLIEIGLRRPQAEAILTPALQLLDDHEYWQHQSDGLAVLLSADQVHIHRLPIHFDELFDELIVVDDHFYMMPLLPLFNSDGRFFILALSQNEVRLLEANRHQVDELSLGDVPSSLADALWYDDKERQLQHHASGQAGSPGRSPAIFHGHGVGDDDHKNDILRFFQQVDRGLGEILGNESVPMVLVGVDYLHPIYHQASHYPHLVTGGVIGNPEQLSAAELHAKAWRIVEPIFQQDCSRAKERFQTALPHGLASETLRELVPAAYGGRVDVAFMSVDQSSWGTFDPSEYTVEVTDATAPHAQDLRNLVAAQTLLNDGEVYALPGAEMPGDGSIVALFRY